MALPSLFTRGTFCGASVTAFSTNIGWNEQSSTLTVKVVVDPANGDTFNPPSLGTPVYFQFYGFRFFGLLQKYEETRSTAGYPAYELVCIDPREILENAQVILGDYNGPTSAVANLLNVYGYAENFGGYGAAQVNQSGMPWVNVLPALNSMVNRAAGTPFGGPLLYRGFAYSLDLSQLPVPPIYYRITGAPNLSLMELISQLCNDGGCDYLVELDGFTIRVRTVSRYNQPPLGTISSTINNFAGNVQQSKAGLELRSGAGEENSAFLVGGQQCFLQAGDASAIYPFFGFDQNGQAILGYGGTGNSMLADLNCAEVADVVGNTTYTCSVGEMRCALAGPDFWQLYMFRYKPGLSRALGLTGVYGRMVDAVLHKPDVVNDNRDNVQALAQAAVASTLAVRQGRLHAFVHKVAEEYLGKKFMMTVPFAVASRVSETNDIVWSVEPTEGGYLPLGGGEIGLYTQNENFFQTSDGRFTCMVVYDPSLPIDYSRCNPGDVVVQGNGVFIKATVDQNIYSIPSPAVLLTVTSPVYSVSLDGVGGLADLTAVLNGPNPQPTGYSGSPSASALPAVQQTQNALQRRASGSFPWLLFPAPYQPTLAFVPMKSNILTYGPWFVAGPPGKVRMQVNSSLTPWEYGSFDFMNLAGNSLVVNAVTFQQVGETASITLTGAPNYSLGDTIENGGPNVTNVHVDYGKDGISTTYEFKTWTPKFGVFSKGNADRFRRLGKATQEIRRNLRTLIQAQLAADAVNTLAGAGRALNSWIKSRPNALQARTPHDVLVAQTYADGNGGMRLGVSSMSYEEALVASNAYDDSQWQSFAAMSLSGLVRPFSTSPQETTMATYAVPSGLGGLNAAVYNPFLQNSDVEVLAWGPTYAGMHAYRRYATDPTIGADTRALALRGPLVVSGWGYGIDGEFYPHDEDGNIPENYLTQSQTWPTGPVDLLWNPWAGTWTCHDIFLAVMPTNTTITPSGSAVVNLWDGTQDTGKQLIAYNWFNSNISSSSGTLKLMLGYVAAADKFYVIAADCQ